MKKADAIVLPRILGEDSGRILKWKVLEGDRVREGQVLAELAMGSTELELESFAFGTILYIEARENQIIHVGDLIAIIGEEGADFDSVIKAYKNPEYKIQQQKILMDGFIGEIKLFAGDYIPENWKLCDGSALQAKDYPELRRIISNGNDDTVKLPKIHASCEINYIICVKGKISK